MDPAKDMAVTINHKTVLRLMNKLGIHSVARRRKYHDEEPKILEHFSSLFERL